MDSRLKQWRVFTAVVVLVMLSLALEGAGAQEEPAEYPSFAEFCRAAAEGSAARLTVAVLLERVDTEACPMAGWRLNQLKVLRLVQPSEVFQLGFDTKKVSDLAPLAQLHNLTELDIGFTSVQNLTPLTQLPNLTKLYLGATEVVDLTPLAELPNLTVLFLFGNEVTDLTPLAELPQLTQLYLRDIPVSDLCPVAHVATVEHDLAGWDWAACEE